MLQTLLVYNSFTEFFSLQEIAKRIQEEEELYVRQRSNCRRTDGGGITAGFVFPPSCALINLHHSLVDPIQKGLWDMDACPVSHNGQ